MPTLLERAKSAVQKTTPVSPEREARLKAAADLREATKSLEMEAARIEAISQRAAELSAAISQLEEEEAHARQAKAATLVAFAACEVAENAVTTANARAREVTAKLADTKEMHQAVVNELLRAEADWPPSKLKTLRGSEATMKRVFWSALAQEIAVTEAPAGVQEWIRRCWAVYHVCGHGGLQGMFAQLFPREFSLQEMEDLRRELEREFLSEGTPE